jgi:phasin family protein
MTPTSQHMERTTQNIMQACEDMNVLARQQMAATMKSMSAALQACGEINQNISSLIQDVMARSMSASKNMMTAKSVREAADTHAECARDILECVVSNSGKISEISARATKQTIEPIAEHAQSAMSKIAQKARAA